MVDAFVMSRVKCSVLCGVHFHGFVLFKNSALRRSGCSLPPSLSLPSIKVSRRIASVLRSASSNRYEIFRFFTLFSTSGIFREQSWTWKFFRIRKIKIFTYNVEKCSTKIEMGKILTERNCVFVNGKIVNSIFFNFY